MTRGVEGRGVTEGREEGGEERVDRRKRSMLTLRTLRTERRATPARAAAAVMAAHANQHGAETPSRSPSSSTLNPGQARTCVHSVPRRGRCALRVASRERVHATRVAESCFTHAKREPSTDRPKDRLVHAVLSSLPSSPIFFSSLRFLLSIFPLFLSFSFLLFGNPRHLTVPCFVLLLLLVSPLVSIADIHRSERNVEGIGDRMRRSRDICRASFSNISFFHGEKGWR